MILCDDCLKKYYENQIPFVGTFGRCETCKENGRCYNIPNKFLKLKRIIKHDNLEEE